MRVTFSAQAKRPALDKSFDVPVTVRLTPSRGMSGEHTYASDSYELRSLLRHQTELPATTIERFIAEVNSGAKARLCGVELNDSTLRKVGYFLE